MHLKRIFAGLVLTFVGTTSVRAQAKSDLTAWRQDLHMIAERVPAIHPNAFYRMPRARWDSAVAAIDAKLPTMTRNQGIVALSQLVAMVNDGHTSINPFFDRAMQVHYYPIELHLFDDGVFVRSAAPKYSSIVGAKVIRVGKVSIDSALAAATTTFGHENDWWARAWAPARLTLAEIVDGLGFVDDPNRLSLVVDKNGKQETIVLDAMGPLVPSGHNPMASIDHTGWIDMRSTGTAPLWLRNPGLPYWSEYVTTDSTLYIAYRAVANMDEPTNPAFWRSVFAKADSLPVARMVIDIRENIGGNSFYNKQVIRGIVARPKLDRPDKLFVITGDRTFSAAMNLIQDIEQWTNATIVGEPTGIATVFFGDHEQFILPASGLTVNVSTLPWYPADPRDKRAFIAPRLYTPMTSAEYRTNLDPAMSAILSRGTRPTVSQRIESAISSGDTTGALRILREAASDKLNRYRSPQADVNALGYRLLPNSRATAIRVFRLNTLAFPQSANAWDSYAEGLLEDGQRDAAIAAYRKAVEITPGYPSSTEALRRLGVNG